jgi:hypothetical protein
MNTVSDTPRILNTTMKLAKKLKDHGIDHQKKNRLKLQGMDAIIQFDQISQHIFKEYQES